MGTLLLPESRAPSRLEYGVIGVNIEATVVVQRDFVHGRPCECGMCDGRLAVGFTPRFYLHDEGLLVPPSITS